MGNFEHYCFECWFFQAVLNQKFTDCFVLVFLDSQAGKTVSYSTTVLRTFTHFHFVSRIDIKIHILLPPAPTSYRAWRWFSGSRCHPRRSRAAVLHRNSCPCTITSSLWSTRPATTCGQACCRLLMKVCTFYQGESTVNFYQGCMHKPAVCLCVYYVSQMRYNLKTSV